MDMWFWLVLRGSAWFCLVLPCCEGTRKVQFLYIVGLSDGYVVLVGSAWFCLVLLGSVWFCLILPCCEGIRKVQFLYIVGLCDGYVVLLGSAVLRRYP